MYDAPAPPAGKPAAVPPTPKPKATKVHAESVPVGHAAEATPHVPKDNGGTGKTYQAEKIGGKSLTSGSDGGIIKAGSKPFIHDDKITKFLLKPGAKHYLDFEKVGYTSEDADLLKQDILNGFSENEMVEYQKNEKTGVVTFNVYMMLGKTKKKRFCTGWQIDAGSDFPRLITGFRKDR